MGLLVAAMLAADMSTDSSYMLTWASVIYNDIVAPWRRPGWTEKKGLLMNRLLVAAIGVFLLFYGLWYPLKGDLWSYLGVTGTIYLASMSTLLVACCYWPRANASGRHRGHRGGRHHPRRLPGGRADGPAAAPRASAPTGPASPPTRGPPWPWSWARCSAEAPGGDRMSARISGGS